MKLNTILLVGLDTSLHYLNFGWLRFFLILLAHFLTAKYRLNLAVKLVWLLKWRSNGFKYYMTYILPSFGPIIRLTAANFFVFRTFGCNDYEYGTQ